MQVKAPLRITPKRFTGDEDLIPDRRAWILEGFLDEIAFACPRGNGADIFVQRQIGAAPKWAFVGFARYRWTTEDEWGFETQDFGCLGHTVWTRRTGPERITTPAGSFDCVKLTNPDGIYPTVWLAAGTGLIRLEGRVSRQNPASPAEVWELTSYSPPPSIAEDR